MIEQEIDQFIAEDDKLARQLENRRSPSPVMHKIHRTTDSCNHQRYVENVSNVKDHPLAEATDSFK